MTLQSFERVQKQPKWFSQAWLLLLLSLFSLLLVSGRSYAVPTMEFFAAGGNPDALGPVLTPQVNTYGYNPNNPNDNVVTAAVPATQITYTLENQQFPSGTLADNGLVFGDSVTPRNIYIPLGNQGAPANSDFASSRLNPVNPQGIDITANYGQRMALNVFRLNGTVPRNTTNVNDGLGYYFGDIVLTWNRPVLNPVINVSGLGGTSRVGYGFSAQFELSNPPAGTTISRLAGRNMAVSDLDKTIRNNSTTLEANAANGGASGSVQILNNSPITSLRFRIYVRTDSTSTSTNWGTTAGDAFLFSSSSVDAVVGDLFVSKTNNATSVTSGGSTTYTVRVTNNGPSTIDGAILNDVIGSGLTATSVVCSGTASNRCTTAPNLANLIGSGVTLPSLASGQFYEVSVTANVTAISGSVNNSATIRLPASNIASNTGASCVTSGSITRSFNTLTGACTSTDTDTAVVPPVTPDPAINEARFTIVPNLPTIFRGGTGTQLVTITNNGPNNATGTIATFIPAPQTGVTVTAVSVVGGGACTFSGGEWSCPVGGVSNGANFQLNVTYSTTSASALGTAQQATIKVRSNEFNPGSGVGETLYKVWGTNQQNEIRPNGAFWVGYTGTGGSAQVGANTDENTPILSAWPAGQTSPTGAYLTQAAPGVRNSVYGASSTTASPTIQRLVTNMSTDPDRSVQLAQIDTATGAGDNRRAWEYRTGIYLPTSQNLTFCAGNTSLGIDDNAYIIVDGAVQGLLDNFAPGGTVTASLNLSAGYHSISYRIINQNSYAGNAETAAGGYGPIGILFNGTCNTTGFDQWTNTAVPASINIIDAVDLVVVKSQRAGATGAFQTTPLSILVLDTVQYQLVFTNNGPSVVTGATLSDNVPTQFNNVSVVSATGANGATACSATNTVNSVSGTWSGPSGATCTVLIQASAGLTTGTYTNTATTAVPNGIVEINNANNSSSVQTAIAPAADLAIVKSQRIGTTGAFVRTALSVNQLQVVQYQLVLTNNGPTAATAATYTDTIPANITGLTVVGAPTTTGIGTVCAAPTLSGQTISGTFTANQSGTCTIVVQGTATTTGSITNTATVTAVGVTDTVTANNSSSVDMTIARVADLSITKTGTQSANSGSLVSYVIRVTNNGTIAVDGAVINDTLPAGLSGAYWNCVVPIDGVFATTANIGTRTDEVCISPAPTVLRQTSSTIAQTVNLPAGQSVEIRVIGRANGGGLSNTASVTVPVGVTDPDLTNNTTAAVNTSVLAALDVASCNAVKILDANGVNNSAVAWPVQQGAVTPTVSFNRVGNFNINQPHTAPSVSTGTAPNPFRVGSGTDRFTKTNGSTWSWTATFDRPVPLNQIYLHINDLNLLDGVITLGFAGGSASTSDVSTYSINQGAGPAQELLFNQSNGQIMRAYNRNAAAPDNDPRGSVVFASSSTNTVTSITLSSTNTVAGDNIAIEFGARVGCDYGDAPDMFGNPRAGVLASYLQMGASIPDTEAEPATPRDFTGDDVTTRDDEDIISVTPQLNIVDTSFSLNGLSVLNTTEGAATLRGWIDINGNNVVDTGELATVAVPTNATAQTVALSWPSLPTLTAGTKLLRFTLLDDANSLFGEIEDHQLEVLGLAQITGRVFTDNSGTTGIAANAYNGVQNTGELGLAGSTVELNNCAGTVIATTQTDGAGDYSFGVLLNQLSTPNFCITQTNLAGYTSVSGTAGYTRGTDTISIANSGALSYTGHNFGDARLNLVLTSDGQQTTTPSGTVSYPHILRSESVLSVGTLNTISTESPAFGWTTVLYRDTNCNGAVDAGESVLTSAIGQLLPNQEICVVQRVNAPANATNGAQHVATLSASYTATVQGGDVLSGSSNTRTDTTLVGTAGLDMRKQVRVVASCPSTGADVAAFTERNTAKNGEFLEYQIIYSNRSTRNLSQLTVRDVAPSNTTFQSAICQSNPSGSSCTAPVSAGVNGDLAWSLTNIAPAATGSVRFCVRVPPLAEPPIQ